MLSPIKFFPKTRKIHKIFPPNLSSRVVFSFPCIMQIISITEQRFPVPMLFIEMLHVNTPKCVRLRNNEIIRHASFSEAYMLDGLQEGAF